MSATETITEAELADALARILPEYKGATGGVFLPDPQHTAEAIFANARAHREPGGGGEESPDLPDGIWARVEMPGYRENTGWVTEGDCFGTRAAVVRDWDGGIVAEVVLGPGCRVVRLPAPLRRPEVRVALPAGDSWLPRDADGDDDGGPF